VFLGSAYKNIGVQPLLDGVNQYLPSPAEIENSALDLNADAAEVALTPDPQAPLVALAFKLEVTPYGQLTYLRVYQGSLSKVPSSSHPQQETNQGGKAGDDACQRNGRRPTGRGRGHRGSLRGRLLFRRHLHGRDRQLCHDLHAGPGTRVSLAVNPKDNKSGTQMSKAIHRFVREDPTFRSHVDQESGETIISGMGELHLEIYVERMSGVRRRGGDRYAPGGLPRSDFPEGGFRLHHKKQTGGPGSTAA